MSKKNPDESQPMHGVHTGTFLSKCTSSINAIFPKHAGGYTLTEIPDALHTWSPIIFPMWDI